MLALVTALFLTCSADSDCVMMTRCSCDCCPSPEPMTKQQASAEKRRCAALGPCGDRHCNDMACPEQKLALPACKNGKCVKGSK